MRVIADEEKVVIGVEDTYAENWPVSGRCILLLESCRCLDEQMMATVELCSNACYVFFTSIKQISRDLSLN